MTGQEPNFTSYHLGGRDAIDYIFYTGNRKNCTSPYEMLPSKTLLAPCAFQMRPLPNQFWGSDHISLMSEFIIREKSNTTENDSENVNNEKVVERHVYNDWKDNKKTLSEMLENRQQYRTMEKRRFFFNDYYGIIKLK